MNLLRYKIWDKQEDIYTLGTTPEGKNHWTAQAYIQERAPWAANPNVKVIIGNGAINGTVFMEFNMTVAQYINMGANIIDGMTDEEILTAIQDFEDNPPQPPFTPSPEERIAAALEYQNLEIATPEIITSNIAAGLWNELVLDKAVSVGAISSLQKASIKMDLNTTTDVLLKNKN